MVQNRGREGQGGGSKRQHDPHKLSENDWVGYYCYCSLETRSCSAAQTALKFPAVIPVRLLSPGIIGMCHSRSVCSGASSVSRLQSSDDSDKLPQI